MKKHSKYAILGLQALERAAKNVAENARKNKDKIPIWENGSIKFKVPGVTSGKCGKLDNG